MRSKQFQKALDWINGIEAPNYVKDFLANEGLELPEDERDEWAEHVLNQSDYMLVDYGTQYADDPAGFDGDFETNFNYNWS